MQKRTRDQIMANILSVCQGDGASKTQVVYQVNLNFHTVNRHLDLLIEKALIEIFQGSTKRYKTTSKGEEALECLKKIEAMYS
jgi:predicted transcriptional regulator